MPPAPFGFMCGGLWFGVFLISQIGIFRWHREIKRSRVLGYGIAGAIVSGMLTVALPPAQDAATFVLREGYVIMTVCCLFVLYVPFFYSIHTSLSIESLLVLMAQGGRASHCELVSRFVSRQLFKSRLLTMVESGYLSQRGEQFMLTPRARFFAFAFASVQSLWRLGAGG